MTTIASAEDLWHWHVLTLSQMGRISGAASAGEHCVWCSRPPDDAGVSLLPGEDLRACRACYMGQYAAMTTWSEWHGHIEGCDTCKAGRRCHVARGRRRLHQQASDLREDGVLHCFHCHEPVADQDLVVAVIWEGASSLYPGYAHVLCLTRLARGGTH